MSGVQFEDGQRLRLLGESEYVTIDSATATPGGWRLYVDGPAGLRRVELTHEQAAAASVLREDGGASSAGVLAGLWSEWMQAATLEARSSAVASTPLRPYAHQSEAVYGRMLPQPRLRFLLADEPGTGKTAMAGLYLREAQRLGFLRRALVVAPAHLVQKWQADFERFFGGGLRRITDVTIREKVLTTPHDLWIVSLDLAAVNPTVQEALRPDLAGWDVVVVDEAHRLTPTAASYYQLGQLLSRAPRLLFLTATPHRGKEFLFRALMHLVDPDVFPSDDASTSHAHPLKPGRLHFIRRMKEELLDYDGVTPLFKGRRAQNLSVPLNATETTYYSRALAMVDEFFPPTARTLAGMVYGKRTASSLHALRETLRRRRDGMGSASPVAAAMENDGEFEDETAREEAAVVVEVSLSARAEREAIAKLLKELEHDLLDADLPVSKWPRIQKDCLAANGILPGGKDQAVVFTEYADTADWLVRRFRAAGYSAERYSGRDHPAQRELIRGRFARREFQVIVSTDAGNEGIDLQTAHVLVNWDIPWSLVRLEQRMGRIHRVGQDRDVELFNLVAAGTREGEALHVLLTNFVVAANQLDGKLFDSLSVVAELINLDVERELRKTYQGDAQAQEALATVRAATVDRLKAAAQRGAAEEDALRSRVDLSKAVEMLQAETLERINPRIVESFLARLQGAGLIAVQPHAAGDGLFSLSVTDGRALPVDLGGGRRAFVATSSNALDVAAAAGADVTKAVRLGPGHPAFLALISAASEELRPLLYRGAELSDPTSVTDYYLCAYEADVTELGGQRVAAWVCLVRVDDTGARRERWETLANLESAIAVNGGSPHPGRIAEADDGAGRAAASDEGRRQAVLTAWLDGARRDLERLPMTLTTDVDPDDRPVARRRIQQAVDHRLADLTTMAQVSIGTPRRIGWARVKALGTPSTQTEINSEVIAMTHVTKVLRSSGWRVADVHLDGRGYDLHALRGQEQRCIEVKGIEGLASSQGVVLTGNELLMARQLARDYWLYVIDRCSDGTGSFFGAYRDPAVVFEGQLKDVALLRLPGSALKAARAEIESA